MGGKCFSPNEKHEEKPLGYPKFTHINTESAVLTKFTNPFSIYTRSIPLKLESKLPFDALICKIAPNQYFMVGGVKCSNWKNTNESYFLRFDLSSVEPKVPCPFIPYGGTLYTYNKQVYLVGSTKELHTMNDQDFENEKIPYPFRPKQKNSLVLNKNLKTASIVRYSIPRNHWKKVKFNNSHQSDTILENFEKLILPGTCKIDAKIYFFSGLIKIDKDDSKNAEENKLENKIETKNNELLDEKIDEEILEQSNENIEKIEKIENNFEKIEKAFDPNEKIYCIDLETRKIEELSTKFTFGPYTELKCSRYSTRKILILGGYDEEGSYNRKIFKFTLDTKCKQSKFTLPEGIKIDESNPPIGKYNFSVFFSYPSAYLVVSSEHRHELLDLTSEVELKEL